MLRIPVSGEATPPLLAKNRAGAKIEAVSMPASFQKMREKRQEGSPVVAAAAAPMPTAEQGELRKRKREFSKDEEPAWEKVEQQRIRVGGRKKPRVGRWLAVGAAVLSLAGGLLVFMRPAKKQTYEPIAYAPEAALPAQTVVTPDETDIPDSMKGNEAELIGGIEKMSREFLEARTVDQMLPLVRDAARVEPLMRAFYPGGTIAAPGMGQFNIFGAVAYRGKMASVGVRTADFEVKQLAFLRSADGLKVDWESYVGWSEMKWPDFFSTMPEKPVLFRAKLRSLEYYNFGFSNDLEWRSFELRSADGEHVVYGYVKRGTELEKQLNPVDQNASALVTVRLKYPPGEKKANQVLVDSFVADGWIVGADG